MNHAIAVRQLAKRYMLRHKAQPRYNSLRDTLASGARSIGRRFLSGATSPDKDVDEEFWALRDVGFTVEPGDRLGIIGRNGAGKSTLLKILSRITEPSDGRVEIRGRVSSLLEVGTGFHPELTGRENIFLNGTILGMSSAEVARKFDAIVAFAEVERFLDTPVKRYSSGMYVRLAFSVAAYLEPDILIVDEVLAVGDAQFQRRCLGRMEELSGSGRTVVFVTHNMDALVSLCSKGIVLDGGKVVFDGTADEARERYMKTVADLEYSVNVNSGRGGSGGVSIRDVWLEDESGKRITTLTRQAAASICMRAEISEALLHREDIEFAIAIDTEEGHRLFTAISSWTNDAIALRSSSEVVACDLPSLPLVPGKYLVSASVIFRGDTLDSIQHCASFGVVPEADGFHAARHASLGSLALPCRFRRMSEALEKQS